MKGYLFALRRYFMNSGQICKLLKYKNNRNVPRPNLTNESRRKKDKARKKMEKWLQRKTSHHTPERRIHKKSSMEEICMRVKYKLAEYPRV